MQTQFFSTLFPSLADRARYATVSRLGFSNEPLRNYLLDVFGSPYGLGGSFLADPVFEATFGWAPSNETMASLSGKLLARDLVDAMDNPPADLRKDYRFGKEFRPHAHQLEAWQLLSGREHRSLVVTSGTGSGKTECFMVPILDSLVKEAGQSREVLEGVRALFLYPLNALINSQKDRLHAWTSPLGGKVRFCLYNGNTPDKLRQADRDIAPNQVLDREGLRTSPPPVLVTNATMLEYMLVRSQDAPIIEKSKGTLRWIVLDEAHSYIGSQAAELSLLLRRVMHAFQVSPGQIRFIATSATIGDPNGAAGEKLRQFLADLAGIPSAHVHVVGGRRLVPMLPAGGERYRRATLGDLQAIARDGDAASLFDAIITNDTALAIRRRFTEPPDGKPVARLSDITALVPPDGCSPQDTALKWLDILTAAKKPTEGGKDVPFLPLRAHLFHQVRNGLWACIDPKCRCKTGTRLDDSRWRFGMLYLESRKRCDCGGPVLDLQSCTECNEPYLVAQLIGRGGKDYLTQIDEEDVDEFALDSDGAPDETEEVVLPTIEESEVDASLVVVTNGALPDTVVLNVDRTSLLVSQSAAAESLALHVFEEGIVHGRMELKCPCCGTHDSSVRLLRRPVLGAPFILGQVIPTLLEYCEEGERPIEQPFRGRRMITFTDSRQGTARIAAKIQQESERNRIRGLVLHRVSRVPGGMGPEASRLKDEIEVLRPVAAASADIARLIAEKEAALAKLSRPVAVTFEELALHLASNEPDIQKMFGYYKSLDPATFGDASGIREFARMALSREFARRPRRANNAETMGLVMIQYPALERVQRAHPPAGMDSFEWRAFLKLVLDYFVRDNTCLDLPEWWARWSGNKISRKWLLGPLHKDAAIGRYTRWPQAARGKRPHRLVRLLAYALRLDLARPSDEDIINLILRDAWADLRSCGVLDGSESSGYWLPFKEMSFTVIEEAWTCPVTRRVLDTTLRNTTPFLPREYPSPDNAVASPIRIPLCPALASPDGDGVLAAARDWAASDPHVRELRSQGLWSDLNDRAVEGGAYFRTAEHSAQQPPHKLETYERLFKLGQLNLLSCSTTMEMGVDIGGISVVAMNNVPPHPANYLQRAGRAGRRSETRAVALTVCKNNPHDQAVFSNTRWPFDTSLPMPGISLSSASIVQRHINSMLLSEFLRSRAGANGVDLDKLTCEWFFAPREGALAGIFCLWAESFLEGSAMSLAQGLRFLVRNTCFDGTTSIAALARAAALEMRRTWEGWSAEFEEVNSRMVPFSTPALQNQPAYKALKLQRARMANEYLLSELASQGFLPAYGFPTYIASFDTLTVRDLKREQADKDANGGKPRERADNRMRRRELPSRDLVTALREYAPGSDVVMDGLVYRSAGITLNWHAPASQAAVREIQNIRLAWRCRRCGASGTEPNLDGGLECGDCGYPIPADGVRKYLVPSGFAVDLYSDVHNDVSQQQFVKPQAPWIHAGDEWSPLPNAVLGRFRATPGGSAFFHASGEYGEGYAVCLQCGRAEPHGQPGGQTVATNGHLPAVFRKPHTPLRGRRGEASSICAGSENPWSIVQHLHLGHEVRTDVLELQLRDVDGQYLNDEIVAFTLAVAIRSAIASMLGVQEDELGCATKEVRPEGDARCRSILVYDNAGSGYVTAVSGQIPEILRAAAGVLDCKHGCEGSCQHCIAAYGTRFQSNLLNRQVGLSFLSPEWIGAMVLPAELAFFGSGASKAEYQPLAEAIWRELARPSALSVTIFVGGDAHEWDLAASPLRSYIGRWVGTNKPVRVMVEENVLARLSDADKRVLAGWASIDQVQVLACPENPLVAATGTGLAEVATPSGVVRWACSDPVHAVAGSNWGATAGTTLVVGIVSPASASEARLLKFEELVPAGTNANSFRLDVQHEANGNVQGFGKRFWDLVFGRYPALVEQLESRGAVQLVEYRDRYLRTPLSVALLVEVLHSLKSRFGEQCEDVLARIVTVPLQAAANSLRPPRFCWSDWEQDADRIGAIEAALENAGFDRIEVEMVDKAMSSHARILSLMFEGGEGIEVHFDQGLPYWRAVQTSPSLAQRATGHKRYFDFTAAVREQGATIIDMDLDVEGQAYPTHLYLCRR